MFSLMLKMRFSLGFKIAYARYSSKNYNTKEIDNSQGEKLRVAGDGSFDTRGYSAEWCRYFLVDADTGEALVHVLMNKKETGSSGKLEVVSIINCAHLRFMFHKIKGKINKNHAKKSY